MSKKVSEYLNEVDYDFPGYIPSQASLKFINFIKLVNMSKGGEENKSPVVHMKMLDSVFNAQKRTAIMCHRGIAKALSLDSIVYSDNGPITIRDLEVGERIFGEDGLLTTVMSKSIVFHKPMYKLILEDGREIKVSLDHINTVIHRRSVRKGRDKQVRTEYQRRDMTTGELLSYAITSTRKKTLRNPSGKEHNFWIPLPKPVNYSEKEQGIDAYEYGQFLSKVREDQKIPDKYLYGSIDQRRQLLAGFLDWKASVTESGSISFICDKELLRTDIIEMIRSFGGIAKISDRRVNVQINEHLFENLRKRFKVSAKSKNKIAIERIERIPSEPSQCISVDNITKTFLTNGYTVTHNTTVMAEYFFLYIATFGKLSLLHLQLATLAPDRIH